jgi:hypothetical protein
MSESVRQFLEIIRDTWRETLYCEHCGKHTSHIGCMNNRDEIYTCAICHTQKVYTVR